MSLNKKLILAFTGVLISFAALIILFDNLFADKFYFQEKQKDLTYAYATAKDYVIESEDEINTISMVVGLNNISQNTGAVIYLFNQNGENVTMAPGVPIKSLRGLSVKDSEGNMVRLDTPDKLADHLTESGIQIEFIDAGDSEGDVKNIAVVGKIVKNNEVFGYLLVYTSYVSIKDNIGIFNIFTLYVTVMILILAIVVASFLSRRLVKPIKEAEMKTRKIADLDFSSKLEIESNDEIGQLAISINKMSDELEKSIKDLKEANEKLEQDIKLKERVNKLREQFISDVSHELKTPISIIGGYAEALKLEGLTQEDIDNYTDIIMDESSKMNKLVKDLLKFTQIESGFLSLEEEDFPVSNLIYDVTKPNELKIKELGVTLNIDIVDATVNGDPDMMHTVFNNFFVNALNHVDGEKIIEIKGEVIGDKYRVSVRNTGTQISEENQKMIWESFYKVDKARSRQYGGSGLGLSIVKSIMTTYGNEFGVFNNPDGVTFYFDLNYVNNHEKE
ncbi:MAG: HAMP domain-containing histidine kinase [Clostridia bacterium]|nr:HAMP domain-containing histidine kinase [Clostridia bacterium]